MRRVLVILASIGGMVAAAPAHAVEPFVPVVKQTLAVDRFFTAEECLLCHTDREGGKDNLSPFGLRMATYGARKENADTVRTALLAMRADANDRRLVEQLTAGQNPNLDPALHGQATPQYGCHTTKAPSGALWPVALAGLGWILRRRRR